MAIPAVPVIGDLPPAPTRSDGPADFTPKADAMIGALQPLVVQSNIAIQWMNGRLTDAQAAQAAAAASAAAAADSASSAATVGGQAVAAAQAARDAAAASALSAQASAEAAGASANFPAFVDGLDVLQVKPDKTGVQWGKVGQAIGDVLETTRTPDATYLLCDTIYTRAAYPELFAIIGTQGEKDDGVNPASISHGLGSAEWAIQVGMNDVFVAIGLTGNSDTGGVAGRSTDKGLTWSPIPTLMGGYSLKSLATDGVGTWVATMLRSGNTAAVARSTDNGLTWTVSNLTVGYVYNLAPPRVVYDGVSRFLIYTTSQPTTTRGAISTNGGATWAEVVLPITIQSVTSDGSGSFYMTWAPAATQQELSKTGVSDLIFKTVIRRTGANSAYVGVPAHGGGISAFIMDAQLFVSDDGGKTWSAKLVAASAVVTVSRDGYIFVRSSAGVLFSSDKGETWIERPTGGIQMNIDGNMTSDGVVVAGGTNTTFLRAARLYNYDVATQFKTPAHKAPKGYKAYIKGKLA